jgi:hypothetical protein
MVQVLQIDHTRFDRTASGGSRQQSGVAVVRAGRGGVGGGGLVVEVAAWRGGDSVAVVLDWHLATQLPKLLGCRVPCNTALVRPPSAPRARA